MNPAWQLIVLLVAAVLLGVLALRMWQQRSGVKALNTFALLLILAAAWCVDTVVDIQTDSLAEKMLLFQLRFLFIPFMAPLVLETVHRFALGRGFFVGWKLAGGLVIPVITVALACFPHVHPLFRNHFRVTEGGPFPILVWNNGPWAIVYLAYCFTLEVWSLFLLIDLTRHSRGKGRLANLCMLVFFLAPFIFDWAFAFGWSPTPGFNYTPVVFSFGGIVMGWSALRYDYFDLVPVARTQLVEHLQEILIVIDAHGHVTDLNAAAERTLAIKAEKAVGTPVEILLGAWPGILAILPEKAVTRRDVAIELNGKQLIHECSILPVPFGAENPRSRILLLRDISDRKCMEAELKRAKEKAEASDEAKGRFLAMMSHEIRTPMNGVIGFAEMLEKTALSPEQEEYVNLISRSSELLLVIINDVLDYSKIEAGRIELEERTFELRPEVEKICLLLALQAKERRLGFRWEIDPDVPRHLVGDTVRLSQILTNLIANAIKFTTIGNVTVRVGCDPLAQADSHRQIIFEVRDTGIGMTAETIERLFQPFSQADSSTSRQFGGTGLGLVISQRLSQLMGGGITVKSEPRHGSTFICTVALRTARPEEVALVASKKSAPLPAPAQLNVLVVEDNQINQRVVGALLGRMGHKAHFADDGQQCLDLLAAQSYDAVLMDIEMPGMDGFETVRRLRQKEREAGVAPVRVIALTAHALAENRERCLAAGMDDYLTKPINSKQLQAALPGRGAR